MLSATKIFLMVLKKNKIIILFFVSFIFLITNLLFFLINYLNLIEIIFPVIYLDSNDPQTTYYEIPILHENVRNAIIYFHNKHLLLVSNQFLLNLNEYELRGILMSQSWQSGLRDVWLDRAVSSIDTFMEHHQIGDMVEKFYRNDYIFNPDHIYFRDDPLFMASLEIAQRAGKLDELINAYYYISHIEKINTTVEINYIEIFQTKKIAKVSSVLLLN